MAITTADPLIGEPPARLLDLTRLLSRAGHRAMTGVDRVERAYLAALLSRAEPCYFLIRTARRFLLLDRAGGARLAQHIDAQDWGPRDWRARLSPRLDRARQRAESTARGLAIAQCRRRGLARMIAEHLPKGAAYLNTGHSNLSRACLAVFAPRMRIAVLLHDTIPLDFPQFQTERSVRRFRDKLEAVSRYADLVICNSHQSMADGSRHMTAMGRCPATMVAHLGLSIPALGHAALPEGVDATRPFFVALGTIEPRKNHALLLDVWEDMARDLPADALPALYILGSRGWRNEAFLQRLEESSLYGQSVIERPGLDDAQVAAMLRGSHALLFPSFAEGFGLPLIEAAAQNTPAICAPLPVYLEFLGDYPVYVPTDDRYLWRQEIEQRSRQADAPAPTLVPAPVADGETNAAGVTIPNWDDHFNQVFART